MHRHIYCHALSSFPNLSIGGFDFRIDLSARKEYDQGKRGKDEYVRLKRTDIYGEIGFGIDFYLKYFKFSPELKIAIGFRDILVPEPAAGENRKYAETIERMTSTLWILSFHFE